MGKKLFKLSRCAEKNGFETLSKSLSQQAIGLALTATADIYGEKVIGMANSLADQLPND